MNAIQSLRAKRLQTFAVMFLVLVGLCVFLSIRASNDAAHSLGPQALAAVGNGTWIADERGLEVTDSKGEIRWQHPFAELGVKGISTMLAVDHERVLLSSRATSLERETQPALPLPDGWIMARLVVIVMWPQILLSVLFVLLIAPRRPGQSISAAV